MMNEWASLLQQDYLWRALFAGLGLSLASGPLGVFVIWKRMAFFGDTLAHSGLLGITLALAFELDLTFGVGLVAVAIAFLLFYLKNKLVFSHDAILGILSPAILAIGLICLSFFKNINMDVLGFLVGDILAISWQEVVIIYVTVCVSLCILCRIWSSLLRITIDRELAHVEGVATQRIEMLFILLLALIVAIAVKLVGVLLISALLIIPAATARFFANTPEKMAFLSCLFGMLATLLGIAIAFVIDLPVGPAIVVALLGVFVMLSVVYKLSN
ncbi:metal ABC transporter permease [Candidatus Berkiella cookevillensis]|uniref:High-affinity zinc uptake system membrane protein ZnuB n=1 Tax=Candidatus Berkiella cookevillensis TaxID=437022 RepID=A0A0Q9YFY8_9GAMM|nr:iron chelate uptake ABC transporter family permease subunit [Candidatus Berkiella cookevillensis]MCS5707463.1 metal ABC transporter permease [Candidatus Berkiella cookevillensis]